MTNMEFDPGRVLGDEIINMSRQELCELASRLCRQIRAEAGPVAFRGGVYPENISVDENGGVSIGLARQNNWEGQEMQFIAPELYWNGKRSPASDVYSVGMLLYYAVNKGKLPYEGECDDAQLRRMAGEDMKAPKAAGRRLGEIIEKALRFKAEDRYHSLEEMQVMLDNCVKNLYLKGAPSAEALFNKSDDDLSDLERIMVGIIERGEEEPVIEEEPALEETPAEEERPEAEAEQVQEEAAGEPAEDEPEEKPKTADGAEPETNEAQDEEQEEIRLYEPAKEKKPAPVKQAVPILTEEKNPELEPVVPRHPSVTPAVQYGKSAERERKIAKAVKKRRSRPIVVILVLCALLIATAFFANKLLKDFVWKEPGDSQNGPGKSETVYVPGEDPDASAGDGQIVVPTPPPAAETVQPEETPKESTYQVFRADVSWTEARDRCAELGGHLVVISDQTEFDKIVELVKEAGLSRAWIGCHRVDGTLVWENEDEVMYYPWDSGEPSYEDSYDGTIEDYLMLWDHNGWVYNDSRNDPVADYPQWYSGTIGYVCEFEG